MPEQSIIFRKGMGFATKPLWGHKYLEKARKKTFLQISFPLPVASFLLLT